MTKGFVSISELKELLKDKRGTSSPDYVAVRSTMKSKQKEIDDLIKRQKIVFVMDGKRAGSFSREYNTFLPMVGLLGRKVNPMLVEDMIVKIAELGRTKQENGAHLCANSDNELTLSTKICKGNDCSVAIKDCHGRDQVGSIHFHPGGNNIPSIGDAYNALRESMRRLENSPDDEFMSNIDCNITYTPVPLTENIAGNTAVLTCMAPRMDSLPKDDRQRGPAIDELINKLDSLYANLAKKLTEGSIKSGSSIFAYPPILEYIGLYEIPLPTYETAEALEKYPDDVKSMYAYDNPFSPFRIILASLAPSAAEDLVDNADYYSNHAVKAYMEQVRNLFHKEIDYQQNDDSSMRKMINLLRLHYKQMENRYNTPADDLYQSVKILCNMMRLEHGIMALEHVTQEAKYEAERIENAWQGSNFGACNMRTLNYLSYLSSLLQNVLGFSHFNWQILRDEGEVSLADEVEKPYRKIIDLDKMIYDATREMGKQCRMSGNPMLTNMNEYPENIWKDDVPEGAIIEP